MYQQFSIRGLQEIDSIIYMIVLARLIAVYD